jgi:invasion protein IalB
MISFRLLGSILALTLCAATPLLAQTTTTDAATQPQAGGDLSLGAPQASVAPTALPTQEQAEVGQTYALGTFDAWEERCKKTADGADPCLLYQLLKDANGNPVSEITVFGLPPGQQAVAGATVIAPLETLLTKALTLAIDGAQSKVYPFAFCTRDGCVARIGLTPEEVDALRKGAKATLTIVPAAAPDQTVALDISLKGFTAGYEAVSKSVAKP